MELESEGGALRGRLEEMERSEEERRRNQEREKEGEKMKVFYILSMNHTKSFRLTCMIFHSDSKPSCLLLLVCL